MTRKPQKKRSHLSLSCVDIVQVDRPLVGQEVEDVQRPDGFRPPLFVAEYEIDPLVELARHKLALQRLSEGAQEVRETFDVSTCVPAIPSCIPHHPIDADKIFGLLGPDRQLHVTRGHAVVTHAELVLIAVDEHLGQVVELWDQLLVAES